MSIKSRKISSSFLIGLFVIAGTIIFVGFMIWMGATQFLKEQNYYVTYFEGSVEGLEPGSAVKFLGVPCGRVSKIQVRENTRLIEVIMNIEDKIAITDDFRVKAELAGIAGGKFLQLYTPTDSSMLSMHPAIDFVPEYTYIKSAPSGIDEITIALREVMDNLMRLKVTEISNSTLGFLESSTRFFNDPNLQKIVIDLASSSQRLSNILTKADTAKIISNIAASSAKLNETADELKAFAFNLSTELNNMQLPAVVNKMYAKYDTTMINTNKSISLITYRMESILFGLNETFEELRNTNRALQRSLRAVSDNPSQIFLSDPPPPEK